MTQEQAKQILSQALDQAFKSGAYSLQDASLVIQALSVLFPPIEKQEDEKIQH